jgi:hypothetical protein
MKSWLSGLTCFSLVLVLLACGKSPATLDRVFVKNATDSRITDVKVYHELTGTLAERSKQKTPQENLGRFSICQDF